MSVPGVRAYLDHNATAPVRPEVGRACVAAAEAGNPSSIHREGRQGRVLVEAARASVAALVGARADDVVFTSGGTEANATLLRPGALRTADGRPVQRLLVGATEHPSILGGHGFAASAVGVLPVDRHGTLDLSELDRELRAESDSTLVSVQAANSETGVLQPLAEIASLVHGAGAILHVDAVQAAGRIAVDLGGAGIDAVTLSAHKLGGWMGAGAVIVADGRIGPGFARSRGGGQERGLRAGTQNVVGIAGFGVAAEIAGRDVASETPRLAALRGAAEHGVLALAPDAVIFGADAPRLPNTLAFAVPGLKAETALMALDLAGVAVSSGSACSSGKVGRSHVLAAMGVPEDLARGAIRVSFGWNSSHRDVASFLEAFETLLQRLYVQGQARAA